MLGRNSQKFTDASIMEAEIETTGYCGGDAKKGGFIEVMLEDVSATVWDVTIVQVLGNLQKIKIVFKGDSEMRNFHKIINQWKEYLDYQLGDKEC